MTCLTTESLYSATVCTSAVGVSFSAAFSAASCVAPIVVPSDLTNTMYSDGCGNTRPYALLLMTTPLSSIGSLYSPVTVNVACLPVHRRHRELLPRPSVAQRLGGLLLHDRVAGAEPASSASLPPPIQSKLQSGPKVAGSTAITAVELLVDLHLLDVQTGRGLHARHRLQPWPTTSDGMALKLVPCTM